MALFALFSLVFGITVLADHSPRNPAFASEVLAYAVLRLVQSFGADVSAARRGWLWGLFGLGALAGIMGLMTVIGYPILFWLVAGVIEFFGPPIDRVRGVAALVASVPIFVIITNYSEESDAAPFVYVLYGGLGIVLAVVTLAPVLFRPNR